MNLPSNKPCPKCQELGRDKDGNNLFLMSHKKGYVCRQNRVHHKPYYEWLDGKEHEPEEYENDMIDISQIPSLPHAELRARGIRKDVAEHFGIRVEYDPSTREEVAYYYPIKENGIIIGYKKRTLPKSFTTIGTTKDKKVEPMGLSECKHGGKKILIVGGQDDMGAAYQILKDKYPNLNPDVISPARGENDLKCFSDYKDRIEAFEEIILCLDNDDIGKAATQKLVDLFGEDKCKVMKLSEKDPNDMLLKKKQPEFIDSFFKAKPFAPDGFITVEDVFEEATAMPVWGKSWPWPSLTKLTYGRRLGEGIYFGAGVKVGKSEAVNQIAKHIIIDEGGKIALFKLEEKPAMTVRKIAGKIMHKQFHVPDGPFTQEELIEGVNMVKGKIPLYDSYGATSWDKLKAAIRHAVVVEGCQDIVIDPLTRLTVGMNAADQNTELERISDEISKMAKDLGFFYMIFCHLKAPLTGKPHEEGGKVHSNQFHGSRAMMRACYYMVGIERDKTAEDEELRNTSQFVLLEDRAFGNSGRFDVFYDRDTGDYLEPETTRF